ncbi:hypothetical protein T01_4423 [Trichinella spiralis]|uniref:DUF5641 domain-containing protein n=1 Tax=Trichinella spiralis TaxID=6334 RepID=A0A0V1BQ43_TRISP|nr:hypothetical protein T01_4423 [Trichinella spiralis]
MAIPAKLVEHLWTHWKREYLVTLPNRGKWRKLRKEPQVGDMIKNHQGNRNLVSAITDHVGIRRKIVIGSAYHLGGGCCKQKYSTLIPDYLKDGNDICKIWGGFTRSRFSLIGLCPRYFIRPSNLCRIGFPCLIAQ